MDVLCFGGEDWWYQNRGHIDMQLMRRFAKTGTILYINSIIMQKLNIGQTRKFAHKVKRKLKSIYTGLQRVPEGFWVYSPLSLPIQHISRIKWLNEMLLQCQIAYAVQKIGMGTPVVWVACPTACDLALGLKRERLVYQRTDRYEDFPGVSYEVVRKYDRKLKVSADLTLYVNSSLYAAEAEQCKRAFYLDHGVDYEMFASEFDNSNVPSDIANIPRPIVGFIGSIDECNPDIDFVGEVADFLPCMSFVFVGGTQTDCSALANRKNVWMLGQKPYELVPLYGKCFDVLLLPLRQTRWTEGVNPLKLKEYLALGKPIVSTPFNELSKYLDVVYEAKSPEAFAKSIRKALDENNMELVTKRRQKVSRAKWDSKAYLVLEALFGSNEKTFNNLRREI
jgi:glycosyltransferase involved in cell wall biosynthesis